MTTPPADLMSWLNTQSRYLGDQWISALEDRKREEAEFHDADRAGHHDETSPEAGNRRFYLASEPQRRSIQRWIDREAANRVVLDYACGSGAMTLACARAGARLALGIDISEISVRNAAENAQRAGVAQRTVFLQRDCEATTLPDASVDRVICSGMLHHLDLDRAYPELHRILTPGGRVLCAEALNYNPAIRLYRRLTPQYRTAWETEHILTLREVRKAERWFRVDNVRYFFLLSPLAALLPAVGGLRTAGIAVGHAVDSVLTRIPLLQLWSWQFTFELVKP